MTDERNKPDHAPAISPEDAPVCCGCSIDPALVERMVKLLRDLREDHLRYDLQDRECDFVHRTAAILAELEPVDPLLVEARGIAAHTRRFGREGAPYSTCSIAEKIEAGDWDDHMLVIAAMDALKRGMELAKEQGA